MALNRLLAVVIVMATAAFAIGVSIEKSDRHTETGEEVAHVEGTEESGESGEAHAAETVAPESHSESEEGEELLGINVESTPLVVLAVAFSLALAIGVWLRPELGSLLVLVSLAMLAFAVLDLREVIHQLDEDETGLAVLAGLVAPLHTAAAVLAFKLEREVGREPRPG
jgi:Flp pilus assembly protein TadB